MKKNIIMGLAALSTVCLIACNKKIDESMENTASASVTSQEMSVETTLEENTESSRAEEVTFAEESVEESVEGSDSENEKAVESIKGYQMVKNDFSVSDDKQHTVTAYVDLPRLLGEPQCVDEINAILQQMDDDYRNTYTEDIQFYLDELGENEYSEEYLYSPIDTSLVYWDADGNISIGACWRWFMGGVYNQGYIGVNYNYITKKTITLEEILGKSRDEIDEMIAQKIAEDCDWEDFGAKQLKEIETYKFYFDESTVYVGFDSYDIPEFGNYYPLFELPR